jgi:hypothetical protein
MPQDRDTHFLMRQRLQYFLVPVGLLFPEIGNLVEEIVEQALEAIEAVVERIVAHHGGLRVRVMRAGCHHRTAPFSAVFRPVRAGIRQRLRTPTPPKIAETAPAGARRPCRARRGQSRHVRLVIGQGMRPAGIGLAAGLGTSLAAGRVVENLLYGITPHDAITYATVLAVVGLSALTACAIPAKSAANVEPSVTLRSPA